MKARTKSYHTIREHQLGKINQARKLRAPQQQQQINTKQNEHIYYKHKVARAEIARAYTWMEDSRARIAVNDGCGVYTLPWFFGCAVWRCGAMPLQ